MLLPPPNPFDSRALLAAVALFGSSLAADAQTLKALYPDDATIVASGGSANDAFGSSIALDGDTMAIGSPLDDFDGGVDQGSVHVFVRVDGSWTLQQILTSSGGSNGDRLGESIALDGDTLAVSARGDDVGANVDQGSVRVFVREGGIWTEQATLTASDGAAGDQFGVVALSGDTLAVGSGSDDVGANADQGSVRVFKRSAGNWSLQAFLVAGDGAAFDRFGSSVALDGETLAVGSVFDDVGPNSNQGSAAVFTRNVSVWSQQAIILAPDGAANDWFGSSVDVEGDTLVVASALDDVDGVPDAASVSVFTRSSGFWGFRQLLPANKGEPVDVIGKGVLLDGDTLVVTPVGGDVGLGPNQFAVRVFVRSRGLWAEQIVLSADDVAPNEFFGFGIALDGDTFAAGVPGDNIGANTAQGSVRTYGVHRVANETKGTYHPSLVAAISAGSPGDRLLVGNPAFAQADGIVDASQKRFTFTALEPIALSNTALMTVANDTVFEKSTEVSAGGLTVDGRLVAPIEGTVTFQQLTVAPFGQLLQRNSDLLVNQSFLTMDRGVSYLQGPLLAQSVSTAFGGEHRVAGDTDVFSNYTNEGTTVIQRGILYIYGTLTNTGTITGQFNNGFLPPEPGDGYSIGGDYAVSADSSIVLPDPVWWLRVGGSFDMAIDSAARFVMDQATLEMTGVGVSAEQPLEVFARDFGAVEAGFATTNYLVGALRIRAGANVSLADIHNNAPGKSQEAIYTNELFVPAGAVLTTNGYRIYTRTATVAGTVSNPADIVVVPDAPACLADIFEDGQVNAADLSALLVGWGPCSGSCIADLDGNGEVGAADLAQLLANWGPCAE
jgi:hypothetical protein